MKTLIENITVIFEDGSYKENIYVAYEDKTFTYIGETLPEGQYDRKISGHGKIMIPGLYNCHTHTPMTHFRGMAEDLPLDRWLNEAIFPAEDKLCDESAAIGALLSCAEMISGGVVSMSDMYFFCPALAEAIGTTGIKANLSRSVVSFDENSQTEYSHFVDHVIPAPLDSLFQSLSFEDIIDDGKGNLNISYSRSYLINAQLKCLDTKGDAGLSKNTEITLN